MTSSFQRIKENKMNRDLFARTELSDKVKTWLVFLACLICSGFGVVVAFIVFRRIILEWTNWGVVVVISVVMLGISYGAKYANEQSRKEFTPVDLVQYVTQGFLFPSSWPALAQLLGFPPVEGPVSASFLLQGIVHSLAGL
jgi:hypothetical protein